jgi:hypothetical protein
MSAVDARRYFLSSSSYSDLALPHYFNFDRVIAEVSHILGTGTLDQHCLSGKNVGEMSAVNHTLCHNRDGAYAMRPYQFINPALYVSLVHEITRPEAWKRIVRRFRSFNCDPRISVAGIPVQQTDGLSDRCGMVRSWYEGMEQRSIGYSLDYRHLLVTDIADCHGSIRPSAIIRALYENVLSQSKLSDPLLLGNVIGNHLKMIAGPTGKGIPSGTMLMNFISELVLGYVDQQLMARIKKAERDSSVDFKIIRFRDDYRIFVNNRAVGERLLAILSEILAELGMKLSSDKTRILDDVISGSIKADKLYWLDRPCSQNLKIALLRVRELGISHPNSGSLVTALSKCLQTIHSTRYGGSSLPLIAIVADIMNRSPRTYPLGCALISHLVGSDLSGEQLIRTLHRVLGKCDQIPNTGLLDVWVQRLVQPRNAGSKSGERLCRIANGEDIGLWNATWLKSSLRQAIENAKIVNTEELAALSPEIQPWEVCMFPKA